MMVLTAPCMDACMLACMWTKNGLMEQYRPAVKFSTFLNDMRRLSR